MRLFFGFLVLTTLSFSVAAQDPNDPSTRLWGVAKEDGSGFGGLFSVRMDGSDARVEKTFSPDVNGAHPTSVGLIEADDGDLYGITSSGGTGNRGVLYKLSKDGYQYTKLFDFGSGTMTETGRSPVSQLLQATDGMLYGHVYEGGKNNMGYIFKINKDGSGFTKVLEMSNTTGPFTNRPVLRQSGNYLYGITAYGGNGGGTIFKLSLTGEYEVVYKFNPQVASYPFNLVAASNGFLYGITINGGNPQSAAIFRVTKTGTDFEVLHRFENSSFGRNPLAMTEGTDGFLYGVTAYGGNNDQGVLFKIGLDGNNYGLVVNFGNVSSAYIPYQAPILASDDFLYGVSFRGGGQGGYEGFVYRVRRNGTEFSTVDMHQLIGTDMTNFVTQLSNGKIITLASEGALGKGSVLEVNPANFQATKVFDFYSVNDGQTPLGMIKINDNVYAGVANRGGKYNQGVVFTFNPLTNEYQVIKDMNGLNRKDLPASVPILASDNYLYGTTSYLITHSYTIYKIKPDGSDFQTIHIFPGHQQEGFDPIGRLIEGMDGRLYGTARGGSTGIGMIYSIDRDGSNYNIIYQFPFNSTSFGQLSGLTQDADGILYGSYGKGPQGSSATRYSYSVKPDGSDFTILKESTNDTFDPHSGLSLGSNGDLFGVLSNGGTIGNGLIYKMKKNGSDYVELKSMNLFFADGATPNYELVKGPGGIFYGTTSRGGSPDGGIAYSITEDGTFNRIFSAGSIGLSNPTGPLIVSRGRVAQTITFGEISAVKYSDAAPALGATSTATGLTVQFESSNPEVATIENGKVVIKGIGTSTITAKQSGNDVYYAALPVTRTLSVTIGSQTITFNEIASKTIGDGPVTLTATASSGLPVSYSTSSDKISIASNVVTLLKAGRAAIRAEQAGNTNYEAATSVERNFCIFPAKPAITQSGTPFAPILTSSSDAGNQWYLNGTKIEGAANKTLNVSTDGVYTVKTTVDDCPSEVSLPANILVTGLHEKAFQRVKIFPNPASHEINFELTDDSHKEISIAMIDGLGRVIEQRQSHTNTPERFVTSGLPKGIFYFRVNSAGSFLSYKFEKQ